MTEFKLNIENIVRQAQSEAQAQMDVRISSGVRGAINALFSDGKYSIPEGLAYELIRKKVEELVLSDDFSKRVDEIVARVADEEIERAARALVNSKARKHLFQPTSPIVEEREGDPSARWAIYADHNGPLGWTSKGWIPRNFKYDLYTWEEKQKTALPEGGRWELQAGTWP